MQQVGIIGNFSTNCNVNKLKIVAKQINSDTILILSEVHWDKADVISNSF